MKKLLNIIQEAEDTPMEVNVQDTSNGIKDPSFVFQINGNFNFKDLERILRFNEQGLTLDDYELRIVTKGNINDADYESFITNIEKLKYLKFLR